MAQYAEMTKLATRRKELGLSRRTLANRAGLTYQTIRNYELGVRFPHRNNLSRIAKILRCDERDLI